MLWTILIGGGIALLWWYLARQNIAVLQPAGTIARQERTLLYVGLLLSAVVVLPVFTMTIVIARKYREDNPSSIKTYRPNFDHSRVLEGLWWSIPAVIIFVLSVITWQSSHSLDPYRPIASTVAPITVDVVALNWKWLFIYPALQVASVNQVELPVNTPVHFHITSDTVMNSFWIPNLGSQIYAMPGMDTQLYLEANTPGIYPGSSANISGSGFAGMQFTANAVSMGDFQNWIVHAKDTIHSLTMASYMNLRKPQANVPPMFFASVDPNLYASVIDAYMVPNAVLGSVGTMSSPPQPAMPGMGM